MNSQTVGTPPLDTFVSPKRFRSRDLVSTRDLTCKEVEAVLDLTALMKARPVPSTSVRSWSRCTLVKAPTLVSADCVVLSSMTSACHWPLLVCVDGRRSRSTRLCATSASASGAKSMMPPARPTKSPGGARSVISLPLMRAR